MASRTIAAPDSTTLRADQRGVALTQPTIPGFSFGGGGGGGSSVQDSFSGIDDPEALEVLMKTLGQLSKGGTPEIQRQQGERNKQIVSARSTLADYGKGDAFTDAAALMAQQLRVAMEKNMPAISKSIQGAGTSSSSMQGLLSQKLATESSQASAALGAEQAKAYGNISAQLQSVLEALTRVDRGGEDSLLKALDLFKKSKGSASSTTNPTNPTTQVGQGGGGEIFQPFDTAAKTSEVSTASASKAPSGYWDYYPGTGHAKDQPAGTNSFGVGGSGAATKIAYNPYAEALSNMYQTNQDKYGWGG